MLHGLSTRSHILRLETPYIQKSAVEITAWACLASTWSWWCPRSEHEPIAAEYRPNLLSHFCFHCSLAYASQARLRQRPKRIHWFQQKSWGSCVVSGPLLAVCLFASLLACLFFRFSFLYINIHICVLMLLQTLLVLRRRAKTDNTLERWATAMQGI